MSSQSLPYMRQNTGPMDSASFIVISVVLHVVSATIFLGMYGFGSMPLGITEVELVSTNASAVTHTTAEARPVQEPAAVPGPVVVLEEAPLPENEAEPEVQPEPAPVPEPEPETAAEEEQPEPENAQAQADAGQAMAPGNPLALFCTHPSIRDEDGDTYVDYGMLGYPQDYERTRFTLGQLALFGQAGGPTIKFMAKPSVRYRPGEAAPTGEVMVLLALRLDSFGRVTAVSVLNSDGNGYARAALEAALRSHFGPAVMDGRPVACVALLPVKFSPPIR